MTMALAVNLALLGVGTEYAVSATAGVQNPLPPYVRLPVGWHTSYGLSEESGAGIIGPNGEVIYFPPYQPNGLVAYVQTALNLHPRYLRAVVDGQRIDVALTSKNLLAVSYPSSDFWTQVKDTKQAVTSFMILLTRLDVRQDRSDAPAADTPPVQSDRPGFPFRRLSATASYSYRKATDAFYLLGDYEHQDSPRAAASTRALPDKPRWQNEVQLLGGNLQVVEDGEGSFVAKFTDRDGKSATYAGSPGDPANALLAILASITRVRT